MARSNSKIDEIMLEIQAQREYWLRVGITPNEIYLGRETLGELVKNQPYFESFTKNKSGAAVMGTQLAGMLIYEVNGPGHHIRVAHRFFGASAN